MAMGRAGCHLHHLTITTNPVVVHVVVGRVMEVITVEVGNMIVTMTTGAGTMIEIDTGDERVKLINCCI